MTADKDLQKSIRVLEDKFGGRIGFLFFQLHTLAMMGQPCDICTYSGERYIDVEIEGDFLLALMYGAGAKRLAEMLNEIKLKKGGNVVGTVAIKNIWVIHPMPIGGFKKGELAKVDLSEGEKEYGPNGETLREMIRNTYRCKDKKEEDFFLRKCLAS